ncbi:MAG: hypothetical protein DLM61_20180 [Pseudonocardiales bacterium]|nr:MAG: hypothetical protein DLM61_20180 [Pseudonocardiales bacterium]
MREDTACSVRCAREGPIMRIRLTWVREDCGNGKTRPRVSSVTPRGTRIVVGKRVTDAELLTEIGDVADDEYVVEISASLGSQL